MRTRERTGRGPARGRAGFVLQDVEAAEDGFADDVGARGRDAQLATYELDEGFGAHGDATADSDGELRRFGVDPRASSHGPAS
jgi:hypothetical protein